MSFVSAIVIERIRKADGTDANNVTMRLQSINTNDELRELQVTVNGYIQQFTTLVFPSKHRADVWVDEEGAVNGHHKLPTCFMSDSTGRMMPLYGPVCIYRRKGLTEADMACITLVRDIDTAPDFHDIPTFRLAKPAKVPT